MKLVLSREENDQRESDEAALQGMGDRLKPIVCSQLFIYVMKMIAQSLRADSEGFRDLWSVVPRCEHSQNLEFVR